MKIKLMFVLPFIVVALFGCGIIERVGEPRYHALSISSDGPITVWNLNRYGICFASVLASESSTAIMAEAGDLLYILIWPEENILLYRYDPKDGQDLSFTSDPDASYKTFLNGQLISLCIYDDSGVWEWIEGCDMRSLRHLRSLFFLEAEQGSLNSNHLQKIAKARPTIGLYFDDIADDSVEIITLFKPTWLGIDGSLNLDEEDMSGLKNLKCLFTFSSVDTQFIEELPHLETLILFGEDNSKAIQFDRIANLRSLTLIEWPDTRSLETFSNRNRLRNLYLVDCEIDDLNTVCEFSELTGLGLFDCEGAINLSQLRDLSHLRWFCFPPYVSQNDFSTFLSHHPGLKVIDLLGCDELNDLSPLARLTEIQGLTLDLTVEDLSPLYKLTDLEVLTLGDDSFDEGDYENLQAALPNTRIAIGGYCLGSGWILLMIPFITVGSVVIHLGRRRSSR